MPRSYDAYGNAGSAGGTRESELDDYTRYSADAPIWGWLSGTTARRDAAKAADEADRNRGYWDRLRAPTADQLMGSEEAQDAQTRALQQLQQWGNGGITDADRAGMESVRARDAQAQGSAQQALMQQAQARGVGGSGLDFATRQMSRQQSQQQASDAEAQMMASAQQRALNATAAAGGLGTQMRGQDSDAVQSAFTDAAQISAGATGQYSTDAGVRDRQSQRHREDDRDFVSMLGSILASG